MINPYDSQHGHNLYTYRAYVMCLGYYSQQRQKMVKTINLRGYSAMSWKLIELPEADCPECYTLIDFHQPPDLGQRMTCHVCGTRLEVASTYPLRFGWFLEEDLDHGTLDDESFVTFVGDDNTEIDEYRTDYLVI